MKSIKPGRGPSMMNGVGAIIGILFVIIWIVAAVGIGAPPVFALFGVVGILVLVVQAIYHFKNAAGENRYSAFDITEPGEEPDPLNARFATPSEPLPHAEGEETKTAFCPYCGEKAQEGFLYCRKCGKKLPE